MALFGRGTGQNSNGLLRDLEKILDFLDKNEAISEFESSSLEAKIKTSK